MEYTCTHNHQSQFIEMFGNPISNDRNWDYECINSVAPESPAAHVDDDEVWLLNLDMIESNTGNIIDKLVVPKSEVLSAQPFDEGNVLFSKLRPYLNKVVYPKDKGYATTELVPLRPNQDKLNKVFFTYLLRSDQFVQFANDISGGTKMPRMPLKELREFKCILPPINLQERFAEIVRQADKSKFDGFKSQFIEWFGDVEYIPLKNVCLRIGEYGSNTPATDYDGSVRYLRITDINDDGSLGNEIVSPSTIEEKYYLQTNDFVFARTGNTVGKTYLHTSGKMIYAGYLIRYKLDETCVLPKFLLAYTHTSLFWDWVSKMKKVGAQPNISAQQYNELPIPRAEIASQQRFVSIAEQADKSKFDEINKTSYGIL